MTYRELFNMITTLERGSLDVVESRISAELATEWSRAQQAEAKAWQLLTFAGGLVTAIAGIWGYLLQSTPSPRGWFYASVTVPAVAFAARTLWCCLKVIEPGSVMRIDPVRYITESPRVQMAAVDAEGRELALRRRDVATHLYIYPQVLRAISLKLWWVHRGVINAFGLCLWATTGVMLAVPGWIAGTYVYARIGSDGSAALLLLLTAAGLYSSLSFDSLYLEKTQLWQGGDKNRVARATIWCARKLRILPPTP